jgi:ATP-dependent Clp protease ATP-binding subunit ClpC
VRFDCSEFAQEHSTGRLIGRPIGYEGAAKGGQLTRLVINNPERVILFDEIERAHKEVLDLLLQMFGEGRLTEQGSRETADFTQSIIILISTSISDAEIRALGKLQEEMIDNDELANAVKSHLAQTGYFRPDLLGLLDKIYIFKQPTGISMAEIVIMKMASVAKSYGLELVYIDPKVVFYAMNRGNKLSKVGIRELDRAIDDMLGDHFIAAKEAGGKRVRLDIEEDGVMAISSADD